MYAFVIHLHDPAIYPPCGLRVQLTDSFNELVEELACFFTEVMDKTDEDVRPIENATTFKMLADAVAPLTGTAAWSLYDDDSGYPE